MNKILILLIVPFILLSCYITPETENGDISVNIPLSSLTQKSITYGSAGFEVFIVGTTIVDYENISEDDELIFYQKDIIIPENVFHDPYDDVSPGDEVYELRLENVPEGDNLFMVIRYVSDDYLEGEPDEGTIGYFMTSTPFSVSSNKTTYLELVSLIMYSEELHF